MLKKLMTGTDQVLPVGGLEKKLATGKLLRVKFGADPTAPDIHLGHVVVLSKLRQFQDAGHTIQFIIGDFTARIGDPTGKSKTRPPLEPEEIMRNAKTYLEQVTRVLDPAKLEIVYNSAWLEPISLSQFIRIAGKVTLARLMERDDFSNRFATGSAIGFHELFYPLLQASDSVHLKSDIELGGTDQTFNLLMGRYLQEQYGQEPQVIMTMPLLEGLDGVQKMSKSLGNYIGLSESPVAAYGKIMSISDELMWRYWLLLSGRSSDDIEEMRGHVAGGILHPLACKKMLAHAVVERFWSKQGADEGQQLFEAVSQQKDYSQAQEFVLDASVAQSLWVVDLLKAVDAVKSSSDARRLIESGAVMLDQEKVTEFKAVVAWQDGTILKVGKHRVYKLRR
ncbi:MAG: tyrosyl-tRNA synthetase [Candidatus Dependentiae bacterium]|nr:tyrosyl-tRNA synthetase [Candidatus Dependentiae bacterium]